ncbi:Gustatory receptor 3 [Frankliniella occidentalis]|uniref:Gustatory receptor n=1 Tax=Frankliniella occidentalis TaxID=133901 RepID=A0A6J1TIF0_FRAOC|nr:gustatory and odorant receptor 24-like isoform X2 [Frankliniella occidentalis]KAE8751409.1 Gustatory receptor 3 [Frankliniella occidentalis]
MSSAGDSPWVISKKYDAWGPPVDASRKRGGDALVAWGAPPGRGGYGPRLGGLDNRGLPVDFKKQTQYKRQKPIAGASKSTASFVDSAMPLIMLMQVGIAFPVQRRADGRLQWKILSPIWLYTLVVYGVLTVPVVFAASAAVRQLAKEDNTFHDQIYNMTPLLLLHAHPLLPFMHWLEAYFVAGYFNSWIKFEELFHKVCRRPLHMGLRGYVARMAAFSFAVAAFLTGTMPMYMSLSWLQCLAYLHLYLLAICLVSVWLLSSKALCIAAEALRESMHEMVVTGACTAERMADYRQAWLELSELTQESGSAWTYQCGHQLLYLFLLMTVTSFGVLAGVARHSLEARTLAYGALAAGSAFILFIVCSAAETAADRVAEVLREDLLMVQLSDDTQHFKNEVQMFMTALAMDPPIVNLSGYATVNRALFASLLETMVTYLVVLVQFAYSLDSTPDNSTSVTTEAASVKVTAGPTPVPTPTPNAP